MCVMYLLEGSPEPISEELSGFLLHWCQADKREMDKADYSAHQGQLHLR